MPGLQWSDAMKLDLPQMDSTHKEFVDLLASVPNTPDSELPALWSRLVLHTHDHFAREDQWMLQTRFSASNCHSLQHKMVLQVLKDGAVCGQAGDLGVIRQMTRELSIWFVEHANTMDAALVRHLQKVGFDPATGVVLRPEALPAEEIRGCGGSCGEVAEAAADADADAAAISQ